MEYAKTAVDIMKKYFKDTDVDLALALCIQGFLFLKRGDTTKDNQRGCTVIMVR